MLIFVFDFVLVPGTFSFKPVSVSITSIIPVFSVFTVFT